MAALAQGLAVMAPLQAALLALAISLAGNAALGWAWLSARDGRAAAVAERNAARGDAQACTDAVDGLSRFGAERAKAAALDREAAVRAAQTHKVRADRTLSKAPVVPGDMCASMQALGDEWLRERGK